jgi:thiol-disulfide isomerase/thioredoxin
MSLSLHLSRRRLLAGAAIAFAADRAAAEPLLRLWSPQRPTPPLTLPLLDGTPWSLAAARGRVVALNFWATWCEPCRDEMPSLQRLAERHAGDGLTVVAVNFKESEAAIRRFLERVPLALPVARDADGLTARAWGVNIFPTTVLVGRNGRVACSVLGEADWTAAPSREWVAALL